jgi:hypothetical protein
MAALKIVAGETPETNQTPDSRSLLQVGAYRKT